MLQIVAVQFNEVEGVEEYARATCVGRLVISAVPVHTGADGNPGPFGSRACWSRVFAAPQFCCGIEAVSQVQLLTPP